MTCNLHHAPSSHRFPMGATRIEAGLMWGRWYSRVAPAARLSATETSQVLANMPGSSERSAIACAGTPAAISSSREGSFCTIYVLRRNKSRGGIAIHRPVHAQALPLLQCPIHPLLVYSTLAKC